MEMIWHDTWNEDLPKDREIIVFGYDLKWKGGRLIKKEPFLHMGKYNRVPYVQRLGIKDTDEETGWRITHWMYMPEPPKDECITTK